MTIAAIVLAAGASSRMGRTKLTLPYGDSTILETVIRALEAAGIEAITVVLGRNWEEVYAEIEDLDVEVFVNPRPERGMASSAQWALAQMRDDIDAFLIVLGDQPQIQTSTIKEVLRAAAMSNQGILVPTFEGKRGHPVLFRSKYKKAILALPDNVGLNEVLKQSADDVREVAMDTETILKDIDTPEDYREAVRQE